MAGGASDSATGVGGWALAGCGLRAHDGMYAEGVAVAVGLPHLGDEGVYGVPATHADDGVYGVPPRTGPSDGRTGGTAHAVERAPVRGRRAERPCAGFGG
ncbi:hypothetical protein [Streptomyces sp. NPDC005486]|uniref:hypothetical protein n=1 Tax=Streptomyces sp. NPDC005486 TaxID=3155345 RepID=UPI0033AE2FD6